MKDIRKFIKQTLAEYITPQDLKSVENYADSLFSDVGIDVEFTKHFLDRVNDLRNKQDITPDELKALYHKTYDRYANAISKLPSGSERVLTDPSTDINVPFVLNWDGKSPDIDLINKTVMRKKDFKSYTPKLQLEEVDEDTLGRMSDFGMDENDIDENGYVTLYHGGFELPERLNPNEILFLTHDYATAEGYANIRGAQNNTEGEVYTIKVRPEDVSWNTGSGEIEFDRGGLIARRNGYLTIIARTDENIDVPINVGDTVLGGKFKNKKITVKDISKNEKGDITINNKPLLKVRLKKGLTENNSAAINSQIGTILSESDIYIYCQSMHRNEEDFWDGDLGDRIEEFPFYKLMEIPIDKINTEEWQLDDDYKEEYIEKFNQLGTYPPIVLGDLEYGKYTIIDGTHRANALKDIGIKNIKAWVGIENNLQESSTTKKLTCLYIHGLGAEVSNNVKESLSEYNVIYPAINYDNSNKPYYQCIDLVKDSNVDFIIGHSVGGVIAFYLSKETGIPALLLCPAFGDEYKVYVSKSIKKQTPAMMAIIGTKDDEVNPQEVKLKLENQPNCLIKELSIGHDITPKNLTILSNIFANKIKKAAL